MDDMTLAERANRDGAPAAERRRLQRLRERGPLGDPAFERAFTGATHSEKVRELEQLITQLEHLR